jgi:hypothetical protein
MYISENCDLTPVLPLRVGGPGGSRTDWGNYFMSNPGSQRTAFDTLLDTSRAFDYERGTSITSGVWDNLLKGNFEPSP